MPSNTLFFSIIIPAHNEQKYIIDTLFHIKTLDYPIDFFEVIVIENGSTDDTYKMVQDFQGGNIMILSSLKKGVSVARNIGIDKISKESDWTIFLDADTLLKKDFLNNLNNFLQKNNNKDYSVGTTQIKPIPDSVYARTWFTFYDIGHRITKTSFSLFIVKSSLLKQIRFNEDISMGEDIKFIKDALRYGKFFFLPTNAVLTSTRRFVKEGWWYIFFSWTFVAMLPNFLKKSFKYKIIR